MLENNTKPSEETPEKNVGVLPLITKKYLWVVILTVIVGLFLGSFLAGELLYIFIGYYVLLGIGALLMHHNLYFFQRFSFRYRPFVISKYFERYARGGFIFLLVATVPGAFTAESFIPYVVLRGVALYIPYQFRSMFTVAHEYKENDPTKCEFC